MTRLRNQWARREDEKQSDPQNHLDYHPSRGCADADVSIFSVSYL
jgi:hypothetical protein